MVCLHYLVLFVQHFQNTLSYTLLRTWLWNCIAFFHICLMSNHYQITNFKLKFEFSIKALRKECINLEMVLVIIFSLSQILILEGKESKYLVKWSRLFIVIPIRSPEFPAWCEQSPDLHWNKWLGVPPLVLFAMNLGHAYWNRAITPTRLAR